MEVVSFDDVAEKYDRWYQSPLGSLCDALEKRALFSLIHAKTGQLILDLGCGTGNYSLELAQMGLRVVGVDASWGMLFHARRKAARVKASFVLTAVEDLPFRNDTFDTILSVTVLCFVESPRAMLREVHRVLKSGGQVILGELNSHSYWAVFRKLKGLFTSSVYRHAKFWSYSKLAKLLQNEGFEILTHKHLIYFPPVNRSIWLKSWRKWENFGSRFIPNWGAFIVIGAKKVKLAFSAVNSISSKGGYRESQATGSGGASSGEIEESNLKIYRKE